LYPHFDRRLNPETWRIQGTSLSELASCHHWQQNELGRLDVVEDNDVIKDELMWPRTHNLELVYEEDKELIDREEEYNVEHMISHRHHGHSLALLGQ
jgi:hypothetical protein